MTPVKDGEAHFIQDHGNMCRERCNEICSRGARLGSTLKTVWASGNL